MNNQKTKKMNTYFKSILLFVLLTSAIACTGQNNPVALYYQYVYAAEDSIVAGNPRSASALYKLAFTQKEPFSVDLKNAINVELLLAEDTAAMAEYLQKYIMATGDTNFAHHNKPIEASGYKDFLLQKIKNVKPVFDQKLVAQLERIDDADQLVRDSCAQKHADFYHDLGCRERIQATDSLNQVKILNLLANNNLNESKILSEGWNVIWLVTLHNSAWSRYQLHAALKKKVYSGEYDARQFAYLADRCYENGFLAKHRDSLVFNETIARYYTNGSYVVNKTLFTYLLNEKESRIVNHNRKQIYMEPYEQFAQKIIWQFQQDLFTFKGYDILMLSEQQFKELYSTCSKATERYIITQKPKK